MTGIFSGWHILLILVVALLLFGNRLPEVARSMGRAINEFKRGVRDVKDDVDEAVEDADKPKAKLKPPTDRNVEVGADEDERDEHRVSRERVKETTPSDS
jgi:sec-independent protein translocase protein TatA